MRFLASIGALFRAALLAVSRVILHAGHAAGFGPHPDELLPPPVGPSKLEAELDQKRAEYEASLEYLIARLSGREEAAWPSLPPRLSGWAHQLERGDVAELALAHRDGRLEGHLDGTRPIYGIPPVGNATETAAYLQRRDLLRERHDLLQAADRIDATAATLQRMRDPSPGLWPDDLIDDEDRADTYTSRLAQ